MKKTEIKKVEKKLPTSPPILLPERENPSKYWPISTNWKEDLLYKEWGVDRTKSQEQINLEILKELNLVRSDPKSYSKKLMQYKSYYNKKELCIPHMKPIMTKEGGEAYVNSISFLEAQKPCPNLILNPELNKAAKSHAKYLSASGNMGHCGPNSEGTLARLSEFGKLSGDYGESLEFQFNTAEQIVISLIVDDGLLSRPNRFNILAPHFKFVGISHTDHLFSPCVTVIEFAEDIKKPQYV